MKWPSTKQLSPGAVGVRPQDYDWQEHEYGSDWEVVFPEGMKEGEEDQYMPMMNYRYPVPGDRCQAEANILAKSACNLTLVHDLNDEAYYLALTGGGMDFSWEICEGYMRLGFLPPLHFCDLPLTAMTFTRRHKWIVAGCWQSARWAERDARNVMDRLRAVRKYYKGRSA